MSEGLPLLDAEHPWPGLFPYGEDAHAFFNGRERETIDLLRLVRRDALTLLYGQSGLGKSSLLRAGLFPIVGVDLRAYGQFGLYAQVVVSVTTRGVRVYDPLLGRFITGLLVFEQAWSGSDFLTILVA